MLETDNNILKHDHGEKFVKFLFVLSLSFTKKSYYLHIAHLIAIEINMIITEVKTMKKSCKEFEEHAAKIINCEKLKLLPLTEKVSKLHKKQKLGYTCRKKFNSDIKLYMGKIEIRIITLGNIGVLHILRCKNINEFPVILHSRSKYDYHLIIKEFTEELKGQVQCFGENTDKYITFSVSIEKELANSHTVTYKIKFVNLFSFIDSSLSSLADNLAKGFHNSKCEDCESCLEYMKVKDKLFIFKCLKYNKCHKKI